MSLTPGLYHAATRMRAASPQDWADFLAQLEAYSQQVTQKVLSASIAELQVAQGTARGVAHIIAELKQAHLVHDRINQQGKAP